MASRTKIAMLMVSLFAGTADLRAQEAGFTYQGKLSEDGSAASGEYDFTFALFNTVNTNFGGQVGETVTNLGVGVTNGLFNATLDFGAGNFNGQSYWLEIGVRTNGGGNFTPLTPLQPITPTPYALFAGGASSVVQTGSNGNFGGTYTSTLILNNASNAFTGGFAGNGAGLTNITGVPGSTLPNGVFVPYPLPVIWDDEGMAGSADVYSTSKTIAGLQHNGQIKLLAFTSAYDSEPDGANMQVMLNYDGLYPLYGVNYNGVPSFTPHVNLTFNYYSSYWGVNGGARPPSAVTQWRAAIVNSCLNSHSPVFIVVTERFDNYYWFLNSPADTISPLTGAQMEAAGMIQCVVLGGGFFPQATAATGVENNLIGTPPAFLASIETNMAQNCVHIFMPYNATSDNVFTLAQPWLSLLWPDDPSYFGYVNDPKWSSAGAKAGDSVAVMSIFGPSYQGSAFWNFIPASNWWCSVAGPQQGSNIFCTNGITYPWYVLSTNVAPWSVISNTINSLIVEPVPEYSRAAEQPILDTPVDLSVNNLNVGSLIFNNPAALTNSFNGTTNASIAGAPNGVTNTANHYGVLKVIASASTWSNFDGGGNWLDTNAGFTGTFYLPIGPNAGCQSAGSNLLSSRIIFP